MTMSPYVLPGLDEASCELYNRIIARVFGVTVEDLTGRSRKEYHCIARHLGIYVMLLKGKSTTQAGAMFGRRHTAAIHAKRNIENIIQTRDPKFYSKVYHILDNPLFKEKTQ